MLEGMPLQFDSEKLHEASALWDEVTLDPAQRMLVQDLSTTVGPALGIDPIPCRGIWIQAVRAWQREHGKHAVGISSLRPHQRLQAALEIKEHFLALAQRMLVDEAQRAQAKAAVDAAYTLYMGKYNRR